MQFDPTSGRSLAEEFAEIALHCTSRLLWNAMRKLEWRTITARRQLPIYDSVDLFAEPLVARRELLRTQGTETAALLAPARPAHVRADCLVDGVADCLALERKPVP